MNRFVKGALQVAEIAGKTAVSAIPVGGALVTSIYDTVKSNCLEKRRKKWQEALENRISKLEATLNDIGNSEIFTTAIIKATEVAMKTGNEEKLKYLANATANSYESNIDETRFWLYMDLVDRYTSAHIEMMKHYMIPSNAEPDREDDVSCMILNTLVSDGLLLYSNDAKGDYMLSQFGRDFLVFLTKDNGEAQCER